MAAGQKIRAPKLVYLLKSEGQKMLIVGSQGFIRYAWPQKAQGFLEGVSILKAKVTVRFA